MKFTFSNKINPANSLVQANVVHGKGFPRGFPDDVCVCVVVIVFYRERCGDWPGWDVKGVARSSRSRVVDAGCR